MAELGDDMSPITESKAFGARLKVGNTDFSEFRITLRQLDDQEES